MAAFNLGQVLGDASQGFMKGQQAGQTQRANEQKMQQSAVAASDAHTTSVNQNKVYAEQIKAAQQQNEVSEAQMPNTMQVLQFQNTMWDKYYASKTRGAINQVAKSFGRDEVPNLDVLNAAGTESKSFGKMFGTQFRVGNPNDPKDVKMATDLLLQGQPQFDGDGKQKDPGLQDRVKSMMESGYIFIGNSNGEGYAIDIPTMQAFTGSQAIMAPEDVKMFERKQMGLMEAFKPIDSAAEGGMSLYDNLQKYDDAVAKMEEKGEPVPESFLKARDNAAAMYYKESFSGGEAAKMIEKDRKYRAMTPAQRTDAKKFKIASEDKGLIKKYDAARDAYDTAATWATTRDKVFATFDKTGLDWNALSNAKGELAGYWDALKENPEDQAAYARIKTLLGAGMADYIKEMSGAAVSNEERMFLNDLVFGGNWKSRDELESRVNTFLETRVSKAQQLYSEYGPRVEPNKTKERLRKLRAFTKPRHMKPVKQKAEETGGPRVEQQGFVGDARDTALTALDDATNAVVSRVTGSSSEPLPKGFEETQREALAKLPDGTKIATKNADGSKTYWIVTKGIPKETQGGQ